MDGINNNDRFDINGFVKKSSEKKLNLRNFFFRISFFEINASIKSAIIQFKGEKRKSIILDSMKNIVNLFYFKLR